MERSDIVHSIATCVRSMVPEANEQGLDEGQDLREYAGFDSLVVLELLLWVESTFSVTIPDDDLVVDGFKSISDIADYVTGRLATTE